MHYLADISRIRKTARDAPTAWFSAIPSPKTAASSLSRRRSRCAAVARLRRRREEATPPLPRTGGSSSAEARFVNCPAAGSVQAQRRARRCVTGSLPVPPVRVFLDMLAEIVADAVLKDCISRGGDRESNGEGEE